MLRACTMVATLHGFATVVVKSECEQGVDCDANAEAELLRIQLLQAQRRDRVNELRNIETIASNSTAMTKWNFFDRLYGQECADQPYTRQGLDGPCNGWNGISEEECWEKCQLSAMPPGCPQSSRKTCAASTYYKPYKWCQLYADCKSTKDGPATSSKGGPAIVRRVANHDGWKYWYHKVVQDEGSAVGEKFKVSDEWECLPKCKATPGCQSWTYCSPYCYFKNKKINPLTDTFVANDHCSSYFEYNHDYFPNDERLIKPSNSPVFTFHVYRAFNRGDLKTDTPDGKLKYPLTNNNFGSLGSIMWYLHNEVIFTCDGGGFLSDSSKYPYGSRKFAIDRIQRVKITYKPPQPLLDKGMHFGVLKSIDHGEVTGPHRQCNGWGPGTGLCSAPEFEEFGYVMGCAKGGEFPHPDWKDRGATLYPDWVWYSTLGNCPVADRGNHTESCHKAFPGGRCDKPDGTGSCTWTYEEDGVIDIDKLVGITPKWKDRAEFCKTCPREGRWKQGSGCKEFNFWGENIFDEAGAKRRTELAFAEFEKVAGSKHLPAPPCDFNMQAYGIQQR